MWFLDTRIKSGIFLWLLLSGLTALGTFATPAYTQEDKSSVRDQRVTFEFNKVPMSAVAAQISTQLNYKVMMDDELASLPVSGIFHDVTLDEFFSRRIFRGKNIAILFDEAKHQVIITTLGNKGNQTEYDHTGAGYGVLTGGMDTYDPMELEVQPGIKRKDIKPYVQQVDPMEMEVTPGVKRRDVKPYMSKIDPEELEIVPGVRHRDVAPPPPPIEPEEAEVQPGIKRKDILYLEETTDPLDLEVQPGIKRRDVLNLPPR